MVVIFSLKKLNDKEKKVELEIVLKSDEKCISVTHGCIRFVGGYHFLLGSSDSLVKTAVDIKHKRLENFKKEENILNNVTEEKHWLVGMDIKMLLFYVWEMIFCTELAK